MSKYISLIVIVAIFCLFDAKSASADIATDIASYIGINNKLIGFYNEYTSVYKKFVDKHQDILDMKAAGEIISDIKKAQYVADIEADLANLQRLSKLDIYGPNEIKFINSAISEQKVLIETTKAGVLGLVGVTSETVSKLSSALGKAGCGISMIKTAYTAYKGDLLAVAQAGTSTLENCIAISNPVAGVALTVLDLTYNKMLLPIAFYETNLFQEKADIFILTLKDLDNAFIKDTGSILHNNNLSFEDKKRLVIELCTEKSNMVIEYRTRLEKAFESFNLKLAPVFESYKTANKASIDSDNLTNKVLNVISKLEAVAIADAKIAQLRYDADKSNNLVPEILSIKTNPEIITVRNKFKLAIKTNSATDKVLITIPNNYIAIGLVKKAINGESIDWESEKELILSGIGDYLLIIDYSNSKYNKSNSSTSIVVQEAADVPSPNKPTPQPTPATSISLISSEKEITAGTENPVYFTASTNSNSDSVIITASKNGIKEREIDLASASGEKWTYAMTAFKTPGDYTLIASARDKSGKITCSSSPITLTVKPAAAIKSVRSSVDSVALGGSVEFTASVQGVVGSNAQVILKLDSYEPPMQFSGNTWKITVPITDVNADGKRTYTAYIKENGISGEMLPIKILDVTSPVKFESVDAKMYGQPIASCALNDEVDFIVKISGGVVPDKVDVTFDNSSGYSMTQTSPGLWWVRLRMDLNRGGVGIHTYQVHAVKSGLLTSYPPKSLTVALTKATLTVEAQDINGNKVDMINLNDQVLFAVNVEGEANGPVRVKVGDWTVPQPLVREGNSKKWRTPLFVPMQQVETKPYYAFLELDGQEAAQSPIKQIVVSRANGLQCPSVAKTGDFINAELLVDNTTTSVKTTSRIKSIPCSGTATETKLQFEKAGYGWVWPGTTVKAGNCGTLEFIADTKTGTALKTYTCTTRVNMDSQPSPTPTPEPQPQAAIESETSTEPLADGFLKLKVKVTKKREPGELMVRAVFPEGGIQTVGKDYANELVVMQLHQEGVDEWAVKLKYPGQRIVPYTIEFWIDGRRIIATAPFAFYPVSTTPTPVPDKEPYANIMCETSLNGTNMSITCYYTDKYFSSRGLEGYCTIYNPDNTSSSRKIFKLQQNANQSVLLAPGKVICDVYHDDGAKDHVEHSHFEYLIAGGSVETVNKLYQSFQGAYNSKNESKIMALISDEWESTGDGTTASDLSMNLRSSFKIFDQIGCTISNLQITPNGNGSGKYVARYDITIKGTIFKGNIRHEEKTSVTEEVSVDDSGKARITKTLNGRFWYVQ